MKPTQNPRAAVYDPALMMTRKEAAAYAGVTLRTVARWLAEGLLTRHASGTGGVLVSRGELESFLSPKPCTRTAQHA